MEAAVEGELFRLDNLRVPECNAASQAI